MRDVVIEECPKCKGHGKIRYKVWNSHSIIKILIAYKKGASLDNVYLNLRLLKIICPLCDGDGFYDWVRVTRRNEVLKNFQVLTGNMDIYYLKCSPKWIIPNSTHQRRLITVFGIFDKPEKLIELSQRHYNNIKLSNKVLSMSVDELQKLSTKCYEYFSLLFAVDENDLTSNKIQEILETVGLSDYMPDKIAIPGPYDYPNI